MTFQALNLKKKHFLDLLDDDYILIMPTYMKGNAWLKLLSHSNFLYVRVTRAITNYVLIEEYCLRFFSKKKYRNYPIESRYYIFHEYRRYNNYWNSNKELLNHFVAFLEYNSGAFFL